MLARLCYQELRAFAGSLGKSMSAKKLARKYPSEWPPNNELQRTSHGQDGGSPLNSVIDGTARCKLSNDWNNWASFFRNR